MTAIIDFPLRWERDNVNRDRLGIANRADRPPEPEATAVEHSHHERREHSQAPAGDHDHKILDLSKLRQNRISDATPRPLFLKAPSRPLRDGEACITSNYTGTVEAAILSLPGIWLIRGGRHYRSFRCWGPDGTGKQIKEWNVVEEAVEIDAYGSPSWKPIHRFVSDITSPELRLQEIDAQLRVLGIPRHLSGVSAPTAHF